MPEEFEWCEHDLFIGNCDGAIEDLLGAATADFAERIAQLEGYRVSIPERSNAFLPQKVDLPSNVCRRSSGARNLRSLIEEAMRDNGHDREGTITVVFLGRNPLYPIDLIAEGVQMLGQEDDVIVIGESHGHNNEPSLTWFATRTFHPDLFPSDGYEGVWRPSILSFLKDVDALIIPVRPVRDIASIADCAYLYHEIEREILLKHWYPHRTYEVLKHLRRLNVIPGAGE